MKAARHLVLFEDCFALTTGAFLGVSLAFFSLAPLSFASSRSETLVAETIHSNSDSASLPPKDPSVFIDENSGAREVILPSALPPPLESKAAAMALYSSGIRQEMEKDSIDAVPTYQKVLLQDPTFVALHLKVALTLLQN